MTGRPFRPRDVIRIYQSLSDDEKEQLLRELELIRKNTQKRSLTDETLDFLLDLILDLLPIPGSKFISAMLKNAIKKYLSLKSGAIFEPNDLVDKTPTIDDLLAGAFVSRETYDKVSRLLKECKREKNEIDEERKQLQQIVDSAKIYPVAEPPPAAPPEAPPKTVKIPPKEYVRRLRAIYSEIFDKERASRSPTNWQRYEQGLFFAYRDARFMIERNFSTSDFYPK